MRNLMIHDTSFNPFTCVMNLCLKPLLINEYQNMTRALLTLFYDPREELPGGYKRAPNDDALVMFLEKQLGVRTEVDTPSFGSGLPEIRVHFTPWFTYAHILQCAVEHFFGNNAPAHVKALRETLYKHITHNNNNTVARRFSYISEYRYVKVETDPYFLVYSKSLRNRDTLKFAMQSRPKTLDQIYPAGKFYTHHHQSANDAEAIDALQRNATILERKVIAHPSFLDKTQWIKSFVRGLYNHHDSTLTTTTTTTTTTPRNYVSTFDVPIFDCTSDLKKHNKLILLRDTHIKVLRNKKKYPTHIYTRESS